MCGARPWPPVSIPNLAKYSCNEIKIFNTNHKKYFVYHTWCKSAGHAAMPSRDMVPTVGHTDCCLRPSHTILSSRIIDGKMHCLNITTNITHLSLAPQVMVTPGIVHHLHIVLALLQHHHNKQTKNMHQQDS